MWWSEFQSFHQLQCGSRLKQSTQKVYPLSERRVNTQLNKRDRVGHDEFKQDTLKSTICLCLHLKIQGAVRRPPPRAKTNNFMSLPRDVQRAKLPARLGHSRA